MGIETRALRLYGKMDLRLESFELPEPADDEILAEIICDSLCMSSHKAAKQGEDHKRVPKDIRKNPVIVGHEFSGRLLRIGARWRQRFKSRRIHSHMILPYRACVPASAQVQSKP